MNDDFLRGRTFGTFIYLLSSVSCIVGLHLISDLPAFLTIILSIWLILTTIAYIIAKEKLSEHAYSVYQLITYNFLGIISAYCFDYVPMFFIVMMLQNILSMLYMDKELADTQQKMGLGFMIFAGIWGFPALEKLPLWLFIMLCLINIAAQWMSVSCMTSIAQRDYRNREQERSLDDMLRVIEAKCDEARDATRSKSDFLSNMSHEIRTPLNSILGMNELIIRESSDENIKGYAENVETSGRLLLSLINDILDFSKIESGKMDIIPVNYQFSVLINDIVTMLSRRFEDKGLTLELEINENIPNSLKGDEVRIRQILTNLMTNAIKYTDKGRVTLSADFRELPDSSAEIIMTITDTGRGIKPEDKANLFRTFSRVDQKRNRNIEGTGLGLSITRNLVIAMNGEITFESEYGKGSAFTVRIPQAVTDHSPVGNISHKMKIRKENSSDTKSFTAPEARILVTDDNASNLLVAKGLLKKTLVHVDTASGGAECLDLMRKNHYDILLLDHMMPEMDGIETLKKIRAENLSGRTRVIALTANAISGAKEMYLENGFEDYLSKPVAGKALEKMLLKYLPKELIRYEGDPYEAPAPKEQAEKSEPAPVQKKQLDYATAMMYCDNSDELYVMILNAYTEQGDEYIRKLKNFRESGDAHNYRIAAHSLKSTSLNIGATELSAQAKKHEYAAAENDMQTVSADIDSFIANYKAVLAEAAELITELKNKLA